jgi:hypothetical protein
MKTSVDHAMSKKHVLVAPISKYQTMPVLIDSQIAHSNYLLGLQRPPQSDVERPNTFRSNAQIWKQAIHGKLNATKRISLADFKLFEWFPLSPGLFHTEDAAFHRKEAFDHVSHTDDDLVVFDPYGKMHMILGGIGNIRLKPRMIEGELSYFMSASSSRSSYDGFPVLIPEAIYASLISEVKSLGAVRRTIEGELRFFPTELEALFQGYTGIPQLYLRVDSVSPSPSKKGARGQSLLVSAAVSFEGEFETERGIFWSYVNFNPADPAEESQRIEWLHDTYVRHSYRGRVVTDFDEQQKRFPDAIFSLNKVMGGDLSKQVVSEFLKRYVGKKCNLDPFFKQYVTIQEVIMGDKYEAGQVGAQGPGAQAHNMTFQQVWNQGQGDIDLPHLAADLVKLRSAMKAEATLPEHDTAVGAVAAAETAAKQGDGPTVIQHLKSAGKWALDTATKIGTTVASAALKASLGL